MATPTPAPTPTVATATTHNPNWVRTIVSSIMLAIVLKAGLAIPFLSTFIAIGIIYLTQVVAVELSGGLKIAMNFTRRSLLTGAGVVIFLTLRFLAGSVLGLYPIDSYTAVDNAGGFSNLLVGRGGDKVIMWEILFAFVAGGLTVAWVAGKARGVIGGIFLVSLIILSVQVGLPKYSATFPSRIELDETLAREGIKGLLGMDSVEATKPTTIQFPPEGAGTATMGNPLRAYFDPMTSYAKVLGEGDAKFVFASDPSIYFITVENPETSPLMKTWWKMPRGAYYIYPSGVDTIDFRWWHK